MDKDADNSVGMSSNVDTDKDSNKNKDKVIQLNHIADKNNHTGKAAKLDVVKQNYNNTDKVTDKKTTEHLPSDIHKTVDKTVKTKKKPAHHRKKTNLVNLKCYQKLEKQLQANHGGAYMRY